MSLSLKIIAWCSLTLIIALGVAFYIIAGLQERLIMGQIENEARAIFKQIVITRQWIADHGGVFVERRGAMQPNPYLQESEIVDLQGKRYLRSSPAMVTKEISKYAKGKELYWFHITSLKLMNPENKPDSFERNVLINFEENNTREFIKIEQIEGAPYLRYMSALYVEKPCLKCHHKQDYKVGDVRGAISIIIPIEKTIGDIKRNRNTMMASGFITVVVLMSALFVIIQKVVLSPMKRLKTSIADFSEGRYSESNMINTGDEFEDLCKTFSGMAEKIRGYHKELEEKIKEATIELAETNHRLIEVNMSLNDLNTRKSDFIARASHELRTPLTTIKGSMDYITSRLSMMADPRFDERPIAELTAFCDLIRKNCERLIRMVNNMLDIERIEQGVFESNLRDICLSQLIKETTLYMQTEADRRGIIFELHIPENIPVLVDEDRIRQVLINLLSNAIKFSPEGGSIKIMSVINNNEVLTSIIDDGSGISDNDKERVFEKFYKGSSHREGSGLGLSISKGIIEFHNGIIGVKDRDDHKSGAHFYFTLPTAKNRF